MKLKDLAFYVRERVNTDLIDTNNYVSTENMLPNKNGITIATSIPDVLSVSKFTKNDVLISNIRPYFQKIWFADKDGGCSNDVLVVRVKEDCNPLFLYYLLSNSLFFEYVMSSAKGTKMPRGDRNSIMQYSVPDFSLEIQRKISHILCVLDEKIRVNKQINDNLELQAQALFKSWFVDFEPFQDGEFVDSELGRIPKGWKVSTISNYIEKTLSGDWGKDNLVGNYTQKVYCIRGADIPSIKYGYKGKMPTRYILEKNFLQKQLNSNDIVIEISGGSPTQSTGRCCFISNSIIERYDKGLICTNFCRALTSQKELSLFIYYYLNFLYEKGVMFTYENGTTGIKNLDLNNLINTELMIIPPKDLLSEFNLIACNTTNAIQRNGLENEKLSQLRDTLLPKLMSGEISVEEIEI